VDPEPSEVLQKNVHPSLNNIRNQRHRLPAAIVIDKKLAAYRVLGVLPGVGRQV